MKRHIRDGTPQYSKSSLCMSCEHCSKIIGESESERHFFCREFTGIYGGPLEITCNVKECSEYVEKGKPDLYQMQKMALILVNKGDKVGFVTAKKFKQTHEMEDYDSIIPPHI